MPIWSRPAYFLPFIRAEYLKSGGGPGRPAGDGQTGWLIGAVVMSSLLAVLILLALLLLVYKYKTEETRHKRLLASPGPSSQDGQSQNQQMSPDGSVRGGGG